MRDIRTKCRSSHGSCRACANTNRLRSECGTRYGSWPLWPNQVWSGRPVGPAAHRAWPPLATGYWNGGEVPGGWDLHYRNAQYLPILGPQLDFGFSALLDDLDARGLLDETLVVWMGEFGRAPLIEREGGRGHWGRCYSIVLAGAGIKPGIVHGRSDRHAAFPIEGAVRPQDLVTTIYHCLGISTNTELIDTFGRPFRLCQGEAIRAVLS